MDEESLKKIILVDDDSFLLDMYSVKFEKSGYKVFGFTDPEACLDKLREGFTPDIILSDLVMSGIDGWTFIKQIREKGFVPHATLIILSNQGQQVDIEKSKQFHVDGYIIKALATPSEVVSKVEKIHNAN